MAKERKKMKNYVFLGFGFPVVIRKAELIVTKWGAGLDPEARNTTKEFVLRHFTYEVTSFCGAWIRFIRKHLELSQEELAEGLGIARTTLINYEKTNLERAPLKKGEVALLKLLLIKGKEVRGIHEVKPKAMKPFIRGLDHLMTTDFSLGLVPEQIVVGG